ncbi:hypothetical protein ACIBCA_07640 [Kitasatospora sp. NPDC051170]|uniref:hypothetical protein n=1 Tax=Kitasatospora sp. NPDC051170 TaxID=3364056 RepID=UPI0037A7E1B4
MSAADDPLLFLDVDGPLIPFGPPPPGGRPDYRGAHGRRPQPDDNPLLSRANPALGARLLALPCTLVWATTWEGEANDRLAPWLGLPRLPFVAWPVEGEEGPAGLHWKTRPLPRPGAAPPRRPQRGLGESDFADIEAWLR